MKDLRVDDLLDDINTDAMTPAWVCFSHRPEDIARDAYAGLIVDGKRLFERDALIDGNFEVIVSRLPQGRGQLARDRRAGGEVVGHPHRHRRLLRADPRPQQHQPGRADGRPRRCSRGCRRARGSRSTSSARGATRSRSSSSAQGGLFPFSKALARGEVELPTPDTGPRPMTMAEKILARHLLRRRGRTGTSSPATPWWSSVDGGYTHEFTTAQVHYFLEQEYGAGLRDQEPGEVRRLRGPPDLRRRRAEDARRSSTRSRRCATCSATFQQHTGVPRLLGRRRRLARHLPRGRARADHRSRRLHPGHRQPHLHGRRQQRARLGRRRHRVRRPRPLRLHAGGGARVDPLRARPARCSQDVTAKDVMLYILLQPREAAAHARPRHGVRRPRPALAVAGRARHARQHGHRVRGARRPSSKPTRRRSRWIAAMRPGVDVERAEGARRGARSRRRVRRRRAHDRPLRRSGRWWPIPAIRTAASRPIRPTAPSSTRSAT